MSDLALFLKQNRHLFSVYPECGNVHRLSDLQLARKGRYQPDWLDALEKKQERWENRQTSLEERSRELRRVAKERAERKELPRLLRRVVPTFTKWRTDPRDVRTIFNPVEFVVFDGMNSSHGVDGIALVHFGGRTRTIRSLERTLRKKDCAWSTIRLKDDGSLSLEQ